MGLSGTRESSDLAIKSLNELCCIKSAGGKYIERFWKNPYGAVSKFSIEKSKMHSTESQKIHEKIEYYTVVVQAQTSEYGTVASVPLPSDKRSGSELRAA